MLLSLQKTYKNKKVFITGHTGFKGSWLLCLFKLLGAQVKGYALQPNTPADLFHLIKGETLCESIIGDIRDLKKIEAEIKSFQPDFIFHLAAQSLVLLSYKETPTTFDTNVMGTANVLEAMRSLKKACSAVLITTDKVYHNNEWAYPYRENDQLGGYDPYSASKACAELVIDSYRNSFFNTSTFDEHRQAIAVARAGNVIGGGDWAKDRLMPDVARALGSERPVVLRNPASLRPWQHVLEPLTGYLLLGQRLQEEPVRFGQAYNFGPHPDDTLPVQAMVELAIENWGKGSFKIERSTNQPHEAGLLKLDISKAASDLGWKPKLRATQAVGKTIDWYRCYFQDRDAIQGFTEKQVFDFVNG
jgi:CDP-glucose 4,6-dehydratase